MYSSHNHYYQESTWNDVQIVHCYDPEYKLGSAGQFIYDLNCIRDARQKGFDVILMLGYTSSSVWGAFYPKESGIVFNMDGMEWKRKKYSVAVKKFLSFAEKLAVRFSDYIIADSLIVKSYLESKYSITTRYIAYGAEIFTNEEENVLKEYGVSKQQYYLCMARMVPENNVEIILDGFTVSRSPFHFLVIGDTINKFGTYLKNKFAADKRIIFAGGIYDTRICHSLRMFCHLYFHGHSAGGTNPSLLEAMSSRALIAAHDNAFNKTILGDDALYFSHSKSITSIIENAKRGCSEMTMISNNLNKVKDQFNWNKIVEQYENVMLQCCNGTVKERNLLISK